MENDERGVFGTIRCGVLEYLAIGRDTFRMMLKRKVNSILDKKAASLTAAYRDLKESEDALGKSIDELRTAEEACRKAREEVISRGRGEFGIG